MNRPALLVFLNTVVFTFILAAQSSTLGIIVWFWCGVLISGSIWLYSYRKERRENEDLAMWEAIRQEKRNRAMRRHHE